MNEMRKLPSGGRSDGAKLRSDGRAHDTGLVRPYRPCPADFREVFLRLGQSKDIDDYYGTNWRVIRRWIEESGGEELRAERYKISGGFARPEKRAGARAKRYVQGRTLAAVTKGKKKG